MTKKRVLVLFGWKSGEHEVSLASAQSIIDALDREKYDILTVGIEKSWKWVAGPHAMKHLLQASKSALLSEGVDKLGKDNDQGLVLPDIGQTKPDVVFPILHGPYGEDGRLQGLFDMLDIPYVWSGVGGSAVGMDKIFMKARLAQVGIRQISPRIFKLHKVFSRFHDRWVFQLPYFVFSEHDYKYEREKIFSRVQSLWYPVFVKPANLWSSVGISKVKSHNQLDEALKEWFKYDRRIVIEKWLERPREIEIAVLGNDEPIVSIAGEITPDKKHEFYSYESKYTDGGAELEIPAKIPQKLLKKLQDSAIRTFKAIDARGCARVDFLVDRKTGQCYLNEINTMPWFTKFSMYPKLWEASGIPYSELLDRLISLALEN